MAIQKSNKTRSSWLTYTSALIGVTVVTLAFVILFQTLDGSAAQIASDPMGWLRVADSSLLAETLATATGIMLAVLGIAITVIAIVVELAANRYNHRITGLFIREPLNVVILGFFVVTTIVSYWASASLLVPVETARLPNAGFAITLVLVTISLLLVLPYFAFVISFVSPLNMIRKIKASAETAFRSAAAGNDPSAVTRANEAVDELHDVIRSAMELSDRSVAMAGINALAEVVSSYQARRNGLPDTWFRVADDIVNDADFISLEPLALTEIETEKTWFEIKVFRQYLLLLNLSSQRMRDIAYLIAINTRRIAADAVSANRPLFQLTVRCFNSYLRSTINVNDVRTSYYLLNQYRLLAESITDENDASLVVEIAEFFRYYAELAFSTGQSFVLEVAAFDVMHLLQTSVDIRSPNTDALLDLLLRFDHKIKDNAQAKNLLGVRRAQIQAATMFLEHGDIERARRIAEDLSGEEMKYLEQIRKELMTETRAQYWELTDRGVTFGYLPPQRRPYLSQLFDWLA